MNHKRFIKRGIHEISYLYFEIIANKWSLQEKWPGRIKNKMQVALVEDIDIASLK